MYKILSYLLICVGLCIILFAVHGMYQVFIGAGSPPAIAHFSDLTLQTQFGPMLLPMEQPNAVADLLLYALLMGFLVAAGGKVAGIGCQLLKNERIYDALSKLS